MTSSVRDNAERHFLDYFGPLGICYKKLLVRSPKNAQFVTAEAEVFWNHEYRDLVLFK